MAGETTPQAGVSTEDHFQSLFDNGAFDTPKPQAESAPEPQDLPPERQVAQPEAEGGAAQEAPQEDAPAQSWESLDQFLTENQLDPEQFKSIPVTVKVDGETKSIPLSDVIKGYQLESHANNKSIELSNQRRAFEQETQEARKALMQQWERNEALGRFAVDQLQADFAKVDWNALRTHDPATYAATWTDFQTRSQQIQGYLQQVQAQKAQEAQQQQAAQQETLRKEAERMYEARPQWRDNATFQKDRESIGSYARNLGFSDAELNQIFDHRYMLVLHDAASYRALQAAKPATTKLVREAPKMAKPGVRSNRDPQQVARQNALERFSRNPRDQDAQAAYFETLT